MIRVMYFEDIASTATQIKEMLKNHGIICDTTDSWMNVHGWIFDTPGENVYDALIFDLKAAGYNMPEFKDIEAFNNEEHLCPTNYYVEKILKRKKHFLLERVILFSAYPKLGKRLAKELNIPIINKNSGDSDKLLLDKIKEFSSRRNPIAIINENSDDSDKQLPKKIIEPRSKTNPKVIKNNNTSDEKSIKKAKVLSKNNKDKKPDKKS